MPDSLEPENGLDVVSMFARAKAEHDESEARVIAKMEEMKGDRKAAHIQLAKDALDRAIVLRRASGAVQD